MIAEWVIDALLSLFTAMLNWGFPLFPWVESVIRWLLNFQGVIYTAVYYVSFDPWVFMAAFSLIAYVVIVGVRLFIRLLEMIP